MPDAPDFTPEDIARMTVADPDELRKAVSHALKFNGRKRNHHADGFAADIAPDHLVRMLERGNYVIMKRPGTHFSLDDYKPSLPLKD
jgi:hypothetical protein